MENKEKTYYFTEAKSPTDKKTIIVKESELTEQQKNLLLGDAIKAFNNLPDNLKDKFMTGMYDSIQEDRQLNPSPKLKEMQYLAAKSLADAIQKEITNEQEK